MHALHFDRRSAHRLPDGQRITLVGWHAMVLCRLMMPGRRGQKGLRPTLACFYLILLLPCLQAAAAITALNGVELSGRRLLVREDREDRDIKQAAGEGENGAPAPRAPRAPRAARGGAAPRGGRGAGRGGRGGPPPDRSGESSGLQVVVRGIPWSYTWRELKDLFAEVGDIERTDVVYVVYGDDGRSRVSWVGCWGLHAAPRVSRCVLQLMQVAASPSEVHDWRCIEGAVFPE